MGTTSYFFAGSELVCAEIRAMSSVGPYRLAVQHAHGEIVEYFRSTAAALVRQAELERLLVAARGNPGPSVPLED
jgi:hypothetical protein